METNIIYRDAANLIDAEYESLVGMTKGELWDYFADQGFVERGMLREESDYLHSVYDLKNND